MLGIGKLPKIPGSYASLVTVIFLYILFHILSVPADIKEYVDLIKTWPFLH